MSERPAPRIGDTVRVLHNVPFLGATPFDYATLEAVDGDFATLAFFHFEDSPSPEMPVVRGTVPLLEVALWCRAPEDRTPLQKAVCWAGFHSDIRSEDAVTLNCGGILREIGTIRHCTSCGKAIGY